MASDFAYEFSFPMIYDSAMAFLTAFDGQS